MVLGAAPARKNRSRRKIRPMSPDEKEWRAGVSEWQRNERDWKAVVAKYPILLPSWFEGNWIKEERTYEIEAFAISRIWLDSVARIPNIDRLYSAYMWVHRAEDYLSDHRNYRIRKIPARAIIAAVLSAGDIPIELGMDEHTTYFGLSVVPD